MVKGAQPRVAVPLGGVALLLKPEDEDGVEYFVLL
jgi:hypothetical protein